MNGSWERCLWRGWLVEKLQSSLGTMLTKDKNVEPTPKCHLSQGTGTHPSSDSRLGDYLASLSSRPQPQAPLETTGVGLGNFKEIGEKDSENNYVGRVEVFLEWVADEFLGQKCMCIFFWILIYGVIPERFVPVSTLCCPPIYWYRLSPGVCWQGHHREHPAPNHMQMREPARVPGRVLRAVPKGILSRHLFSSANGNSLSPGEVLVPGHLFIWALVSFNIL